MQTPSLLQTIAEHKKQEVHAAQKERSLASLKNLARQQAPARNFLRALCPADDSKSPRIIAECKHRSPSKGVLWQAYQPSAIAQAYERGGAAAISVLTDSRFFGGSLQHLKQVKAAVKLPVLRKDFIVDEYQIWETRAYGGDSFLLLSGFLEPDTLQDFIGLGRQLGMEPLVESHTPTELEWALQGGGHILGVNNRNLHNFAVNLEQSQELVQRYHSLKLDKVFVCESGLSCAQDIARMQQVGYKAFLVGEALMTSPDKEQALKSLLNLS